MTAGKRFQCVNSLGNALSEVYRGGQAHRKSLGQPDRPESSLSQAGTLLSLEAAGIHHIVEQLVAELHLFLRSVGPVCFQATSDKNWESKRGVRLRDSRARMLVRLLWVLTTS